MVVEDVMEIDIFLELAMVMNKAMEASMVRW